MNEFDIFIKNIVMDYIRDHGTCSDICEENEQLTFYVDIENPDNVISHQQFKVTYPITYSIQSAIKHEVDLLRYLDSGEIRTPFTTDIVEVLKSELESFMYSNKSKGEYQIY